MEAGLLNKVFFLALILLFNNKVLAVEFQGKFIQGSFILGKTNSSAKVTIDNS